jgi:hypothetical protein
MVKEGDCSPSLAITNDKITANFCHQCCYRWWLDKCLSGWYYSILQSINQLPFSITKIPLCKVLYNICKMTGKYLIQLVIEPEVTLSSLWWGPLEELILIQFTSSIVSLKSILYYTSIHISITQVISFHEIFYLNVRVRAHQENWQMQFPRNVTDFKQVTGFQISRRTLRKLMYD